MIEIDDPKILKLVSGGEMVYLTEQEVRIESTKETFFCTIAPAIVIFGAICRFANRNHSINAEYVSIALVLSMSICGYLAFTYGKYSSWEAGYYKSPEK